MFNYNNVNNGNECIFKVLKRLKYWLVSLQSTHLLCYFKSRLYFVYYLDFSRLDKQLLLDSKICSLIVYYSFIKLPLRGSLALLVILTFSQGFCGLCYGRNGLLFIEISNICLISVSFIGLFLASVIFDQETAIQATLASFYPFLLMSGIIWPIEAQPVWLKSISSYLPLTYASESFRAILEKSNIYFSQ